MNLSFKISDNLTNEEIEDQIMNEAINTRQMYEGLGSREIFQIANQTKIVDAKLIDLIPRMVTSGAGFMNVPLDSLTKDAYHTLFESRGYNFKNRDQLLKLITNGWVVMVWSDKYFLPTVPFAIKNTEPKTIYVNMASCLVKNPNGQFNITYRKENDAIALLYTAMVTCLYSRDNWVPNVLETKTLALTYSNMMAGTLGSIYKVSDPITSAKFKFIFSKFFFIQTFGTEKGSNLCYSMLNSHFEDLLGKSILANLDNDTEKNIDSFDSLSKLIAYILDLIKSPHVKELPLGVFIESWVRRYGVGAFLAIDYAGFLVYTIVATRFMASTVSFQTIEKQLPKTATDCFRLWDSIKIV